MAISHRLLGRFLPCLGLLLLLQARSEGQLSASVSLNLSGATWDYTVTNTEPSGSPNQITTFFLPINGTISNLLAPTGWDKETDYSTFVLWANTGDPSNDIASGVSLSGFQFTSNAPGGLADYTLLSFDHTALTSGPSGFGRTLAPVPEPCGLALLLGMGVEGARVLFSRRQHKKAS